MSPDDLDPRDFEPAEDSVSEGRSLTEIPPELPVLPLRGIVVYPLMVLPLTIGQARSIRLVDEVVVDEDRFIGLFASKNPEVDEPTPDQIHTMGTAAVIHRLIKAPDGTIRIIVQGMERIHIEEWLGEVPFLTARVAVKPDKAPDNDSLKLEALTRNVVDLFRRLISLVPHLPDELMVAAANADDPRQLAYLIATSTRMGEEDAQQILELNSVSDKLEKLTRILTRELEVLELGKKIQSEAQSEMERMQREYFLREQLKAIQRELGEGDEAQVEIEEFREKIARSGLSNEAEREAQRELKRLEKLPPASAEYGVIRTYLDWLTSLPWQITTQDNLDIAHARQVLDEDHYDLDKIKKRIVEFLAVRKLRLERSTEDSPDDEAPRDPLRREREGVILCFVGPPGVGKTSLGQSIARAMERKFVRLSLGGVRDEAEIRGHRRTYIGAMPGSIIQTLRRVGSKNPVMMFDEIDKVGADWRGDPASALLEVLDPEQNREFRDHYLDVAFDLSQVMFITTANVLDTIPPPLRDRMEILQLSGYTEEEKLHIANNYLTPRQIRENSLRPDEIAFEQEAVRAMIRDYTREAGVRNLERQIGTICRKVATKIAEGSSETVSVTPDLVREHLGPPKFFFEAAERTEVAGVATGVAWTPTGGDILFVEATRMPGRKGFTVTGQLGDVMKESAQAALSVVRSQAKQLGFDENFFADNDLHLHVPAGAIPKDGPSAGVTMATALASLLTNQPVRADVSMTGEITLRGQILPVGGIKEKVLAAHRAGLRTLILPKRNANDLEDLPDGIRQEMNFIFAERIEEVWEVALRNGITLEGASPSNVAGQE
ncbi:MAG: endopeptidase La [Anaerolineae bacterium]